MSGGRPRPKTLEDLRGLLGASPADVAPIIGLSRGACYTACQRQDIPSRRIGSRVVVDVQTLLRQMGAAETNA
jgi:hypothetical protein